jgi:hypothetical protein
MTDPKMPEVGASPLLNRKVVDKPIVDPLLSGESQPTYQQPQPQPQQPTPQPQQAAQQPSQQAQPQQPSQPFNPLDFAQDPSTERLTQPQTPLDDPSIRSMSFEFDEPESSEGGGESSGGSGGGASTIQLPKGESKAFAKLMVQIGSAYIPMLCTKIASVNISELEILEAERMVPHGSVELFRRINASTEQALQITEEEQKMLYDALKAYLEWKNIEAANPGTALAIALGVVGIRIAITTVTAMSQNKAMYRDFLKKNNIPTTGAVDLDAESDSQTKQEAA